MKEFLTRRWRMLTFAITVGIAAAFVSTNAHARHQATHLWSHLLAWAGFSESVSGSDQVFWCPMHPEIKRNQPNEICPICNMALVELETGATSTDSNTLALTPAIRPTRRSACERWRNSRVASAAATASRARP